MQRHRSRGAFFSCSIGGIDASNIVESRPQPVRLSRFNGGVTQQTTAVKRHIVFRGALFPSRIGFGASGRPGATTIRLKL